MDNARSENCRVVCVKVDKGYEKYLDWMKKVVE
jgi:uncharacterized protein involved in tolerance to divalent cations